MLDLYEAAQFAAFAELGTLARVAEEFHISTPSVTRSMQHIEECFGVSLFTRGKNKIALNETGLTAAALTRKLLAEAEQTVAQVRAFDARRKTIILKSCAPAPVWELLPKLTAEYPDRMISSEICLNDAVQAEWNSCSCDIAILPFPTEGATPFLQEHLFVCVPKTHELAHRKALTFADINGFNFLLRTQLGFWDTLCREKMPASKFLIQTDMSAFDELVRASSLPCFVTDYIQNRESAYPDRVRIPLTDPEAQVTFYISKRGL